MFCCYSSLPTIVIPAKLVPYSIRELESSSTPPPYEYPSPLMGFAPNVILRNPDIIGMMKNLWVGLAVHR